jgi:hypothetical protein
MTDQKDRLDIVEAFADGESVAAADLDRALAHEDARAHLIDVLALRGLVSGAKSLPSLSSSSSSTAARARRSSLRLVAAAAVVVISVASGYAVGRRTTPAVPTGSTSITDSTGGVATPPSTERTQPVSASPSVAPAPTHVFRMENGVTWNERAGGN